MKIKRFLRDSVLATMAFVALQTFQAHLLKEALIQQEQVSTYNLQNALAGVLNQAHKTKDDLSLYHVINALSKSPGIIQASLVDAESESADDAPGIYSYVLQDGSQKWGKLVISISDHFRRALVRRQWILGTAAAGLLCLLLFVYLQLLEKRTVDLEAHATELDGVLQSERRKLLQSQEREQKMTLQALAGLQNAVRRISVPLMVLDGQQRLSAVNEAALSRLQVQDANAVLGKSWHEIPALNGCEGGLQRSLESPGRPVEWEVPNRQFRLRFESDADKLSGTWIFL